MATHQNLSGTNQNQLKSIMLPSILICTFIYLEVFVSVTEICTDGRIQLAAATEGNWTVDFVNDVRVSAPLDTTLDKIMIPVSIVLLLIMVIVTLVLHFYQ